MRILEQKKIHYICKEYDHGVEAIDGITVANILGESSDVVFKTLVTKGSNSRYFVFVVPAAKELNLKSAAKAAGEKSLDMLPVKELLPVTGYVRGGCSPIGMKKLFPTFLDESALAREYIYVSGGRIGCQMQIAPRDLLKATNGHAANIVV